MSLQQWQGTSHLLPLPEGLGHAVANVAGWRKTFQHSLGLIILVLFLKVPFAWDAFVSSHGQVVRMKVEVFLALQDMARLLQNPARAKELREQTQEIGGRRWAVPAFRVAGAVGGAFRRTCGTRGRRRAAPGLPFVWQVQCAEPARFCASSEETHIKLTHKRSYAHTLCLSHSLNHYLNHSLLILSHRCLFESLLSSSMFPSSFSSQSPLLRASSYKLNMWGYPVLSPHAFFRLWLVSCAPVVFSTLALRSFFDDLCLSRSCFQSMFLCAVEED